MKMHVIVDFMHLYYKYKYTIDSNRIKRLIAPVEWMDNQTGERAVKNTDVSYVYYPIKEIEGFRRQHEKEGFEVTLSVCFDSKSKRKESNEEYKSNRPNKLTDSDFQQINVIEELLRRAGYNIYKEPGFEADDLIATLVDKYANQFDCNLIYTSDTDMLAHVSDNVGVQRYKSGKNYTLVLKKNFAAYCSNEFNCNVLYNTIILYKVLCGDKSDDIKGVKGFGPAAFNRLIEAYKTKVNYETFSNPLAVKEFLMSITEYLGSNSVATAIEALDMVGYMEHETIQFPTSISNADSRHMAYMPFGMKSLID